ncbi:MAG TPA: hypothetical protein VFW26_03540, partial [Gaiellales bacterium]|nr:hypothetical protein [Gaiellales bacterium]
MYRKAFIVLALLAAMPGQAPPAFASTPSVLLSTTTTGDRYHSQVTFTYTTPVLVTDPSTQVSFHRTGSLTPLAVTVTGSGTATIVVTQNGTLASGAGYTASVRPDDPSTTPDTVSWKTRAAPAHPTLHVKIITALAPDAVYDIVHRLDRANLLAVPRAADLVDISAAAALPHALANTDLAGYQAALVVTDQDVFDQLAAASALTSFAAHGHGVVLGGQTHWTSGGLWTQQSAIG